MVHALIVSRRLLRPQGVLVDVRNDRFASIRARHDQVYCLAGDRRLYAGPLRIKKPLADFRAADRAIREVVRRGLFRVKAVEVLEIRSYYNSPLHIERYAARSPYVIVEDWMLRRLHALLRRHPGAKIMIASRTRLNVLART